MTMTLFCVHTVRLQQQGAHPYGAPLRWALMVDRVPQDAAWTSQRATRAYWSVGGLGLLPSVALLLELRLSASSVAEAAHFSMPLSSADTRPAHFPTRCLPTPSQHTLG